MAAWHPDGKVRNWGDREGMLRAREFDALGAGGLGDGRLVLGD